MQCDSRAHARTNGVRAAQLLMSSLAEEDEVSVLIKQLHSTYRVTMFFLEAAKEVLGGYVLDEDISAIREALRRLCLIACPPPMHFRRPGTFGVTGAGGIVRVRAHASSRRSGSKHRKGCRWQRAR